MLYVSIPLGPSLSGIAYGPGTLGTLISNTVGLGITIGSVFALLWLLWGGISWITSSGDKTQLEAARDRIVQALIGFAVVMSVWAIWILLTRNFFGLNLSGGDGGGGSGGDSTGVKSGCQIVQTDGGPGCWCVTGDWQFHCFDITTTTRGTPASQLCKNDCDLRNGQPL